MSAAWQAYVGEDGSEAWAVWELLKGHCKSDDSWEDARTEAGRGDTVYEGEEDDFDDDNYVWELLRDDISESEDSEGSVHLEEQDVGVVQYEKPALSSSLVESQRFLGADKHSDVTLKFVEDLLNIDADVDDLVEDVRYLSESVFKFDCIDRAEERDWKVTVLTEVGSDGKSTFCGFICYVHYPAPRAELNIKLLAVSRQIKGRGHGSKLMQWFLAKAAQMPESECRWITVSAWESAVSFYEKFDFCDFGGGNEDDDEDDECEEEQYWMELKNTPIDTATGADGCSQTAMNS